MRKFTKYPKSITASTEGSDRYDIIECSEADLNALYESSALSFEGCAPVESNFQFLEHWLNDHNCSMKIPAFYVITGSLMNDYYGLTGDNAYPTSNFNIVCIKLSDLTNVSAIITARFELGGRWFDDIVDNNERRQSELNSTDDDDDDFFGISRQYY